MRRTEVIQLDPILAAADRQPVAKRTVRHRLRCVLHLRHLLHVGARVFVRDDLHGRSEELVASDVIAVRVCVDDD
jgi:hypothetical protein